MSKRAVLWTGFLLVHLVVASAGFVFPNQPMGDVTFVYEPWAARALAGDGIMGVDQTWVYPQLALVPMLAAQALAGSVGYEVAWALLVTASDALAFALLVGAGRSRGRVAAAGFWLLFALALGPVGMYRLDGVTVPLAVAGVLWLVGRPRVASVALAVAMWIKVWPAALLAAAVVASHRRVTVFVAAFATSAAVLLAIVAFGGGAHAFGFIAGQTGRGLQIEAPVSGWVMWQVVTGAPDAAIAYDVDLLTFQVQAVGVDLVSILMTPLLVLVVGALVILGAVKAWRGATFAALFPPLALALVLALIVVNKVGSPQFLTWVIAPIVIGLVLDPRRWWRPGALAVLAAGLTQVVYPLVYDGVLVAQPLPVALLTLRNVLLVVLFVWAVVRTVRVRTSVAVTATAS
ncbi:glycosyltransferase 87 family protein [Microbacterium aquimaris]|uniref:Glycosyltransferase 87 family protein n=1 Tax=Microbacterium aquimaris TaxID=459816 RepID=A0ABU5N690_9MICO|nr:glycosyltransferase 87 family protein [Microbacterium aquimaris]MDZ8161605.1 glycosyltransferase 87 family protein [Microbacterium aquimaris]